MSFTMPEVVNFVKGEFSSFDNALYRGEWRGFDVYTPLRNDGKRVVVGGPFLILVRGNTMRMATQDEAFECIDEGFFDEYEESEAELATA